MNTKRLVACLVAAVLLGACNGAADTGAPADDTTTTTVAPATTAPATTVTTAPETTTTTSDRPAPSTELARLHQAMALTAEALPSVIEGLIEMTGVPSLDGPIDVSMPISISTDPATGNTAMAMDMSQMAAAMADEPGMEDFAGLMGSFEVRQIGDVVYLRFPFFTMFLGADTEWISMPAEEDDITDDLGTGATPDDPASMLDSFSELEGDVEIIGSETIGGVATTRYRLIATEDWREGLSSDEVAELESQGIVTEGSFPLDLWIDDDGLVRRMAFEVEAEADDEFESMTATFDFSAFGEPVTIDPPPADQVTDLSDLDLFGF